jgi:hypothetical protein
MKKVFSIVIIFIAYSACSENTGTNNNLTAVADSVATTRDSLKIDDTKTKEDTAANSMGNELIVAGKSIGKINLGMNDSLLGVVLGKADMSDAAMGKAWLTWYGKKPDEHNNKTELNIFTSYKDTSMREKVVQQVRTTSSFFSTASGLHVYSSLQDIKKQFPQLKKAATYNDSSSRTIIIYDEQQQGIAFEMAPANQQEICTGIIIHEPGIKVTQTYISLHPGMHIF